MNEQSNGSDMAPVAMILAAGKGTRMRPLTDHCPKPLLSVSGQPLIEWHLQKLKAAGVHRVVINASYLAEKIDEYFSQRSDDGLIIDVINEGAEPLETAGGIVNASALLGKDAFILINGDVWIDLDYQVLVEKARQLTTDEPTTSANPLGELVLVQNPDHNPEGDFSVSEQGYLQNKSLNELCLKVPGLNESGFEAPSSLSYTYSGVSIFHPSLFKSLSKHSGALGPFLRQWADQSLLRASVYDGYWLDVGTPERLRELDTALTLDAVHG
ncbi:nucleotidyltransferase family protein [Litoribrevibacter euphylliae]|uniref:Nucleotidyltransferase family protein n=1 Tax=Litoribrevibacter euphylliae TaxID=1834034 RepID=A0ABV7HDL1_9GAMM